MDTQYKYGDTYTVSVTVNIRMPSCLRLEVADVKRHLNRL